MHTYVSPRGRVGVAPTLGGALVAVVLAPLVLGAAIAAIAIAAAAGLAGAATGRHLRVSASALGAAGWAVAVLIPLGLIVAFFGHESAGLVEAGAYTALGAVPTSIGLVAASVFTDA